MDRYQINKKRVVVNISPVLVKLMITLSVDDNNPVLYFIEKWEKQTKGDFVSLLIFSSQHNNRESIFYEKG